MLLRWDRSYIREELRFGRIVWSRPLGSRLLSLYESTITNLRYPVGYDVDRALGDERPQRIRRRWCACSSPSWWYRWSTCSIPEVRASWDFVFGILYALFLVFALT